MRKTKQRICMVLIFSMLLSFLPSMAFAMSEESSVFSSTDRASLTDEFLMSTPEYLFEHHSIDEIRQFVDEGGQVFQNLRVQYEGVGTITYRVPVHYSDVEYLIALQADIQPFADNPFGHVFIRHSGLPLSESIVIILIGDGFTAAQNSELFHHAYRAMVAMEETHPFGLFSDLFTVIVINASGVNPDNAERSYLGTVAALGDTTQFGRPGEAEGGEFAHSTICGGDYLV